MQSAVPKKINSTATHGMEPLKCIKSHEDMQRWLRCTAYNDLMGFLKAISEAVQGVRINDEMHVSQQIQNLIAIFDDLQQLVDETPPIDQPQRFGNKAFRDWSAKMQQRLPKLLSKCLPANKQIYLNELACYAGESFGNAMRIDYGTGHELSFVFFMCALFKAEILQENDLVACCLRLFNRYLQFVRNLQRFYRMEPAGSHGVWSLDDYQFVPFIWGSAQLVSKPAFEPAKFTEQDIIDKYKDEYMFISCIDYINQVKIGNFAEHSNQLWSISAVSDWLRINTGLCKMYQKEILTKFPIMQHVYFGKLMCFITQPEGMQRLEAHLEFKRPDAVSPTAAVTTTASGDSIKKCVPSGQETFLIAKQSRTSNQDATCEPECKTSRSNLET